MINADFESVLIPEKNGKQNAAEFYLNKCQNRVGYSCGYKLVCVDDQFCKPFHLYLVQDAVHKLSTSMTKESKYCSGMMKKKNLLWLKKIMKILRVLQNVGIMTILLLKVMLE